jgi:predicted nucleic acid-binding protein
LPLLPVDRAVAEKYARIAAATKAEGRPRPQFDLLIAATAVTHGITIATCNPGHFGGIDWLEVEDWSA